MKEWHKFFSFCVCVYNVYESFFFQLLPQKQIFRGVLSRNMQTFTCSTLQKVILWSRLQFLFEVNNFDTIWFRCIFATSHFSLIHSGVTYTVYRCVDEERVFRFEEMWISWCIAKSFHVKTEYFYGNNRTVTTLRSR